MSAYEVDQEWNDLFWGTGIPVAVRIGSNFAQVRARGKLSFAVKDPVCLEAQVPDPEQLAGWVKALLISTITDVIGEQSSAVTDITQLKASAPQMMQALQTKLDTKVSSAGLRIKGISIEAIEGI